MQDQPATTRHGVTRKGNTKRYMKSVQKEPAVKRRLLILDLKAISIIGQRKAFYRQKITESSCARKETVDIDILVPSSNGERKIMPSNE